MVNLALENDIGGVLRALQRLANVWETFGDLATVEDGKEAMIVSGAQARVAFHMRMIKIARPVGATRLFVIVGGFSLGSKMPIVLEDGKPKTRHPPGGALTPRETKSTVSGQPGTSASRRFPQMSLTYPWQALRAVFDLVRHG
jgi:hypothetical protein